MKGLFARSFAAAGKLELLGVRIDPVNMRAACDRVVAWATSGAGGPRVVVLAGAHGIVEAGRDASLRAAINRADLVAPDGMPLVWIGRRSGMSSIGRVFGPDLMVEVCGATAGRAVGHFFCGGPPGLAGELAQKLSERFPWLTVGGVYTPTMEDVTREDFQAMAGAFKRSGAKIFWVGVSTPKQERWMSHLRSLLHEGVLIGVGAAFLYNTDRIRRAPAWMQKGGLEWLYRLLQEPARLAPRYLYIIPLFILRVGFQLLFHRVPASQKSIPQ